MTRYRWHKLAFLVLPLWGCCCPIDPVRKFANVYLIAFPNLIVGWAKFLQRVYPHIHPDPFSLGLSATCILLFVGMMHWFLQWLHHAIVTRGNGTSDQVPAVHWRLRSTLCIVGIVFLIFVAGTASVGIIHQMVWITTRD